MARYYSTIRLTILHSGFQLQQCFADLNKICLIPRPLMCLLYTRPSPNNIPPCPLCVYAYASIPSFLPFFNLYSCQEWRINLAFILLHFIAIQLIISIKNELTPSSIQANIPYSILTNLIRFSIKYVKFYLGLHLTQQRLLKILSMLKQTMCSFVQ